jgi:hypothetical protein
MYLGCIRNSEDGFESNSLFANEAALPGLGGFPNTAQCLDIVLRKPPLVIKYNDTLGFNPKGDAWRPVFGILVVIRVLNQFKHEMSLAGIQVLRQEAQRIVELSPEAAGTLGGLPF